MQVVLAGARCCRSVTVRPWPWFDAFVPQVVAVHDAAPGAELVAGNDGVGTVPMVPNTGACANRPMNILRVLCGAEMVWERGGVIHRWSWSCSGSENHPCALRRVVAPSPDLPHPLRPHPLPLTLPGREVGVLRSCRLEAPDSSRTCRHRRSYS